MPFITVLLQFAALLIVIVTLILRYKFEVNSKYLIAMVVISLIITIVVLVFSPNSIMNACISVIVPALFYFRYRINESRTTKQKQTELDEQI